MTFLASLIGSRALPWVLFVLAVGAAVGWVEWEKGQAFDRGVASISRELVAARERFEQERNAFNAKLNRLAGSIKRRCSVGERLPECAELER